MKYQLVLQVLGNLSLNDYERMVDAAERLAEALGSLGVVDGPDAGAREMSIAIHTEDPHAAFHRIGSVLRGLSAIGQVKAAYRELGGETFTILHPAGATTFAVR